MLVTDAITMVTKQFNDNSNAFVDILEIANYLWYAECEMCREVSNLELLDTSQSTVVNQQEYPRPIAAEFVTRVIYRDYRLKRVEFREIEAMDVYAGDVSTGDSWYYYEYGDNLGLYPTPQQIQPLKIYYNGTPPVLSSMGVISTDFSTPTMFHNFYPDYALWRIFAKDQDINRAEFYNGLWTQNLQKARTIWAKRQYSDRIFFTKDQDSYPDSDFGMV